MIEIRRIFLFLSVLFVTTIIAVSVAFAWSGPSASPPTGNGLLYYASGNVGIGTTNPGQKLDVNGTIQATGFKLPNGATNGYVLTSDTNGVGTWATTTGGSGSQWTTSGSNIYYNTGNVGIGTASPSAPLHVNGSAIFAGKTFSAYGGFLNVSPGEIRLDNSNYAFRGHPTIGGVVFINADTGAFTSNIGVTKIYGGTDSGADLTLESTAHATKGNVIVQPTSGNVGIGTASPVQKFHVVAGGSASELIGLKLQNQSGGAGTGIGIEFSPSSTGAVTGKITALRTTETGDTSLAFYTWKPSVLTEQMRLTGDGNLGIGTASPASKLHVIGVIENTDNITSKNNSAWGPQLVLSNTISGGKDWFILSAGGYDGNSPLGALAFHENYGGTRMVIRAGGNVGIGTTNPASRLDLGGGCMTGSSCSDIRMKTNIESLPQDGGFLAKILQLQGTSFEWKNMADGKRYIGLVAQDVEKVIPEVVTTSDSNDGQKGLSCTGLDAALVEAVKEQQRQIESSQAKGTEQQLQIESLRMEIEDLKIKFNLK